MKITDKDTHTARRKQGTWQNEKNQIVGVLGEWHGYSVSGEDSWLRRSFGARICCATGVSNNQPAISGSIIQTDLRISK